jgi:TetR/AcrR family transcriptional regulator
MSIASRKEREKEQRRSDILQAAEELFFARGFDSVSMDDIAKKVELNKATLYLYFKDKESLFFAVVLRGVRILYSMVKEKEKREMFGADKFWATGHAFFEFADRYPDHLRLYDYFQSGRFDPGDFQSEEEAIGNYWRSGIAQVTNDEYAAEIIELRKEMLALRSGAIKAGMEEGTIRPGLDPVEVAVVYTLLLESMPNMRIDLKNALDGRGIDRQKFISDIRELMGKMILKK